MKLFVKELHKTSLFFRVALVTLLCTICIFIFTSLVTISISKDILVNTFSASNYKILNQVADHLSALNDNTANILAIIENNSNFKDYLSEYNYDNKKTYEIVYNMQKQFKLLPDDVYSNLTVYIIGVNGETYIKGHNYYVFDNSAMLKSEITQKAIKNSGHLIYDFSKYQNVDHKTYSNAITAAKVLQDRNTKRIYGYAYIIISQDDFRKYYMPFVGSSNNIAILSQDGTIVSSSKSNEIGQNNKQLLNISKHILNSNINAYSTKYGSVNAAILSTYLPYYDFNMVGIIDKNIILNEMFNTSKIYIVNILIVLFCLIGTFIIIRRTTKPLSHLAYKMSQISCGNFNDYIKSEGSTEVRELTSAYNYMLDGINKYMNDMINMEKEKRKAEIHALQMQINPHFLYNTLASIKWLIWEDKKDSSIKTIDAFISLLRNTISNKNEMITIEEEIENLKNYVLINHIRYGENITVNYFVNEQCNNYTIPKLILQPFIENAFFHAFTDRDEGLISVFISLKNNTIITEIIDNGIGIPEGNIDKILVNNNTKEHFTSIGINNVNERIKLIYGDDYGVTITSEEHYGTSVKIVIPAVKKENN